MEKPLSDFWIKEPTWLLRSSTLVFLAIGIFLNAYTALRCYFKKRDSAILLRCFRLFSFFSLFFTATITMDYEIFHRIPAFLFFLLIICLCFYLVYSDHFNRLEQVFLSVFIWSAMTFSLLFPYKSYVVFKIVYFTLILLWNIHFLFTRMKEQGMKSNKEGFLKFFQ